MHIHSLNISKLSNYELAGKTHQTGIFKRPVQGPLFLSKDCLIGDEIGDVVHHGSSCRALYTYSLEYYQRWEKILGRTDLHDGIFGENITWGDSNEDNLCVGDQLEVGDAIIQVTFPRTPCSKLNWALSDNTFLKKFREEDMPGTYFSVVKEGNIKSGDSAKIVHRDKNKFKILEVYELYRANYRDKSRVIELMQLESMHPWYKNYLNGKLSSSKV